MTTTPRPNAVTVEALLDTTWRLTSAEAARTDALDRKASTLATFAGLVVSLTATLGLRFVDEVRAEWSVVLFLGGLASLMAAVGFAIYALLPREYLMLDMDYIRRFPTWSQIFEPPEVVRGETMQGLIVALASERDLNRAKAEHVRRAFIALGVGLLLVAAEATTLAVGWGGSIP